MNNIEHQLITIPLTFETKNYTNVFKDKNNKTLQETIKSQRYKFLADRVIQNYSNELCTALGVFLLKLKNSGNEFYKEFLNKYGDLEYSTFYLTDKKTIQFKRRLFLLFK